MKWYAVKEDGRDDDDRSHTVSLKPDRHGWTNDSGVAGYGLTWEQARNIEGLSAEVERLRAENRKTLESWGETMEEYDAYRAAVAEARRLFAEYAAKAPNMPTLASHCLGILDKLPRDEP